MSAIGLIGINPTQVVLAADADVGKSPHKLGDVGQNVDSEGLKIYKFIEYREGNAAVDGVAGEAAYYYTLDGYKSHLVSSDLSDSVEIGAGILQAAMSDGDQGWVQIKGPATMTIAFSGGTDGDPLTPTGAADGTLDVSAAVTDNVCAIAGDASDNEIVCDFPW